MTLGSTQKDNANTPVGSVYVPNTANSDLTPMRGANTTTDANGQKSAAASMVVENAVALGQATMLNSSPTAIASDQPGLSQMANSDGLVQSKILAEAMYLYSSGGPLDSTGKPTQLSFDRMASLQGKGLGTGTVTATVAGDVNLVFSSAPKTIMPGQRIRLSGATREWAVISSAYVPSSTATSIPLQVPLAQTGNAAAAWDVFNDIGPGASILLPSNIGIGTLALSEPGTGNFYLLANANQDNAAVNNILEMAQGAYNGSAIDRLRVPTVFKPFNAQAVTVSSANTPTAIWTPAAGKKFRLMGYSFSSTVAAGIVLHDLATVGGTGLMPIPSPVLAATGIYTTPPLGNGILSATINNKLWIDATVATTLTGYVWGTEE